MATHSDQGPSANLRVSLVQGDTRWHDPAANRDYYGAHVRALQGQTDLVVLPETFTSGFSNDALDRAEGMDGPTVAWLRALARDTGLTVTGSMQCRTDVGVFNRLLWAQPDGQLAHYDKRHLFRMAGEHERYAAGRPKLTVQLNGWRIRPLVCYDLRFPVFIRQQPNTAELEYDLLVFVANWPAPRRHAWRTLLRARAIENLACCVGVNRCGEDGNGVAYAGDSVVLDHLGEPLVECGSGEQVVIAELDAAALRAFRTRFPAHQDADRFELLA
jgi:predicted amidohydrolase